MREEKINTRHIALASLVRCERDGSFLNLETDAVLKRHKLSEPDRKLYTALVAATQEKAILLDTVISQYVKKPLSSLDVEVLCALRLGAVQILFFDKIPDSAACDMTVDAVKKSRCRSASGLVNAVLRKISQDKDRLKQEAESAPAHIKYSMPEWIVNLWKKTYGEERTLSLLKCFSSPTPLTVHINTLKISPSQYGKMLEEKGVSFTPSSACAELFHLRSVGDIRELPGYSQGLFFVQGSASCLAVKALELKENERVCDVCACPGGKSFAASVEMRGRGDVYSFDLHENKLSLIEKGAQRLGIEIIHTSCHDARESFSQLEGTFDAVIADVPCSGLGVIAKKPDIRKKKESDVEKLPEIQYAILENASKLLKKGGRLLYSTCTLNPDENEKITETFLSQHGDFVRKNGFPKTYFPSEDVEDGFFADILIKV